MADTKRIVVSAHQSPTNAKRWQLALSCGHTIWVTAARRPKARIANCEEKDCKITIGLKD